MKEGKEPQQHASSEQSTQESQGLGLAPPRFALTAGAAAPPPGGPPAQMMVASHQVAQLQAYGSGPTGVTNPNAIIPVADLITYIESVERAYASDNREQILTRIRQMYYNGLAFSQLIPNAPSTEVITTRTTPNFGNDYQSERYDTRDREIRRHEMNTSAFDHLTARADENGLGDNPSPYILLANGERIDLGHMLLGMDALAHPSTGAPYSVYGVPNIDPSSWVADLGIAAVWMQQHEDNGSAPSDAPRQIRTADLDEYYRMSAPTEDLLGDVDSFGAAATASSNPTAKLSAVMREYYLGTTTASPGVNRRWQTFCSANGIRYTASGGTVTWDPSVYTTYEPRINRFNDLFGAGRWGAFGRTLISPITSPPLGSWRHTRAVLDKFLDWMKPRLEGELNGVSAGATRRR